MKKIIKRIVLVVVGWGFILVGIVGLFLPVLQGVLFILIGLIILSSEYVWAHRLLERVKTRFPGVARKSLEATARAKAWLGRLGRRPASPE